MALPGSTTSVTVNTVGGQDAEFHVELQSKITDLLARACKHFDFNGATSYFLRDTKRVDNDKFLADLFSEDSSPIMLHLVACSTLSIRRRVWMVPTLGFKGSGKGQSDQLEADDTVELIADEPLNQQMQVIYAAPHGQGSFETHCTQKFVIPYSRVAEPNSRTILCTPPRPKVELEDNFEKFGESTVQHTFGTEEHYIVLFVPKFWREGDRGQW